MPIANQSGKIYAISISVQKGMRKRNVATADLQAEHGIVNDAHAGPGIRQVSLLSIEAIEEFRLKKAAVQAGDFAENITTQGVDLLKVQINERIHIGDCIVLEVTQIGKDCHSGCEIALQVGECIMPRQGIFCRVIQGGQIKVGDSLKVVANALEAANKSRFGR